MPAVTVWFRPNGAPMASTQSPTCDESELPSFTVGNGWPTSILMTARSVSLSTPTHLRYVTVVIRWVGGELHIDAVALLTT